MADFKYVLILVYLFIVWEGYLFHSTSSPPPVDEQRFSLAPITAEKDRLFHFVHISDIHISKHRPERLEHFSKTISIITNYIRPSFVVATGDLTHARNDVGFGSQIEDEWRNYNSILSTHKIKDIWIDMRGNHDCFDTSSFHPAKNWFNFYSSTSDRRLKLKEGFRNLGSKLDQRSFLTSNSVNNSALSRNIIEIAQKHFRHQIHGFNHTNGHLDSIFHCENFGCYCFVLMDACPSPVSLASPLNFHGSLSTLQLDLLEHFLMDKALDETAKHTVVLSHYPMTSIADERSSSGKSLYDILIASQTVLAYLCGHLHTLFGLIPEMYYLHANKLLEIELGDFKESRRLRIAAFDHDYFSFVDVSLENYLNSANPFVELLVTFPPASSHLSINSPSLELIRTSTHIRVLVFKTGFVTIDGVETFIDAEKASSEYRISDYRNCTFITIPWNPSLFSDQTLHNLKLVVQLKYNNLVFHKTVTQTFTLSHDVKGENSFLSSILLGFMSFSVAFRVLFCVLHFLGCLVLQQFFQQDYKFSKGELFPGVSNVIFLYRHLPFSKKLTNQLAVLYLILFVGLLIFPWFVIVATSDGILAVYFAFGFLFIDTIEHGDQLVRSADCSLVSSFLLVYIIFLILVGFLSLKILGEKEPEQQRSFITVKIIVAFFGLCLLAVTTMIVFFYKVVTSYGIFIIVGPVGAIIILSHYIGILAAIRIFSNDKQEKLKT